MKVGKLSWKWREWTASELRELGSLSNDDGDGNEYGKKAKGLDKENNNFARASRFFVVPNSRFVEDRNTGQQLSFSFLELWHSPSELNSQKIANIWRIKRDGISAIMLEAARIHFLSDVFVALSSLLLELSSDGKINRFAVSAVKST